MRIRITIAMVIILVVALTLAGAISFILVRNADKQNAIAVTLAQTEALVSASKASPFLKSLESNPSDIGDLREVISLVGEVAGLQSAGTLVISKNHLEGKPPPGLSVADLNISALANNTPVDGSVGNLSFAAAPLITLPADLGGVTVVILLISKITFSSDSVKYFTLAGAIALIVAVLGTLYTTRRISNHVVRAAKAANAIAYGELDTRIATSAGEYPELILLEEAINTMAERVAQARQLERQFLLSISHDLRTPLTSIRGFAEAIAENVAPDPSKAAQVLIAESSRLERLIKDLLDLAYLEARRFSLQLDATEIVDCIQQVATSFTMEARQCDVDIIFSSPPKKLFSMVDKDRLSQIMANLLQNALKFTRSKITITISDTCNNLLKTNKTYMSSEFSSNKAKQPKAIFISVEDDGLGIADEDLPHVFERLYTSDRRIMRSSRGTGLGLAIVKELTEAMGGRVFVISPTQKEGGTLFSVVLKNYDINQPA